MILVTNPKGAKMKVRIHLSRFISDILRAERNIILDFAESEITLKELIEKMIEIYGEKLRDMPVMILVDGKRGELETKIKDGTNVVFMIPYAGG